MSCVNEPLKPTGFSRGLVHENRNAALRGRYILGDKLKPLMEKVLQNLAITETVQGKGQFNTHETLTLLMCMQMVWNEKEELVEKVKRLEDEMSCMEPADDSSIAGSSLFTD